MDLKSKIVIALAADHRGLDLKNSLYKALQSIGYEVLDFGPTPDIAVCDYPDYAQKVSEYILDNEEPCRIVGVLVCNSGIGMSIAANRFTGIRAALCYNLEHAEMSRKHNNANVIALGASKTNIVEALEMIDTFIKTPFSEGKHSDRIEKIDNFCSIKQ